MISKAKFLAKEAVLRVKYMTNKDCIFCKIVAGEMKTNAIYEDEFVIAFPDINPVSKVHILIVPKKHIESVTSVDIEDTDAIMGMFAAGAKIVVKLKLDAYRLAFNGGRFQHVAHMHWHLVAGNKIEWSRL